MWRPWQIWLAFSACSAVLCAALGWLTVKALELDAAEAAARQQAVLEENSRLALWRMDTALAAIVAAENAQPHFHYRPFLTYPVAAVRPGASPSVRHVPSPLLVQRLPGIRLHFDIAAGPDGELGSPELPRGKERELALANEVELDALASAEAAFEGLRKWFDPVAIGSRLPAVEELPAVSAPSPAEQTVAAAQQQIPLEQQRAQQPQQQTQIAQGLRNDNEYLARAQWVGQNSRLNFANSGYQQIELPPGDFSAAETMTSVMTPLWIGGELILARKVRIGERIHLQGCWLDWPGIRSELLSTVRDLLPSADLIPASAAEGDARARMLTALPLQLVPGIVPADSEAATSSPIRLSISVAWVSLACMLAAVGVMLRGVVALSERRAAFVSAVTHELRTPLTTFRLYAEMLSEGMVRDESDRKSYLETLRTEADRLTHLVENVLAYARLERGTSLGRVAPIEIEALLDRTGARLQERAAQAGIAVTRQTGETCGVRVVTDPAAVEQILFNLVDNACKYASSGEKRITIEAEKSGGLVLLKVRDFGPGIDDSVRRRLFVPFHKSAQDAALSAPGVGLGLALCRRLAQEMGARLRLDSSSVRGTCFVLELPVASHA